MEKQEEFYATYKFYDERGRRLSIFGRLISDGAYAEEENALRFVNLRLQVYVVTCGNKDRFNKKKALRIFKGRSEGESSKGEYEVDLDDPNKPKWTFIKWCEDNFYKPRKVTFEFEANVLVRGKETDEGWDCLDEIIPLTSPKIVDNGL